MPARDGFDRADKLLIALASGVWIGLASWAVLLIRQGLP